MKKFYSKLLIFGLLCLPSFAFCQLSRGCFIVDGTANFSFSSRKSTAIWSDYKEFSAGISPTMGYFLVDRLAVGVVFSGSFSTRFSPDQKLILTQISAGPSLRYYFNDRRPVSFFVETSGSYGKVNYQYISSTKVTEESYLKAVTAGAGMSYFLNQNVALEMTLGWLYFDYDSDFNSTFQLGFGFSTFLGGKSTSPKPEN